MRIRLLVLTCLVLAVLFSTSVFAAEQPQVDKQQQLGNVLGAIRNSLPQAAAQAPKQVVPASAIVAPSENLFQNVLGAINSAASTATSAQIPAATAAGEFSYVSIILAEKADRALLVETYPLPKVIEIDVSSEKPVVKKEVEIANPSLLPELGDYWNTPEGLPVATVSGQLQQTAAVLLTQQEDVALLQPEKIEIDIDASGKIAGIKTGEMLEHTLRLEYGPHFGSTHEIELRIYNDACRQKVSANGIALDDDAFAKTPAAYQIEAYRTLGECYAGRAQSALVDAEKKLAEAKQDLDSFLESNINAASQKSETEKKKAIARMWEFASFPELYNETKCSKAQAGLMLMDISGFEAIASLRDYYGKNCEATNRQTEAKTYISKAFDAYAKVLEKFSSSAESVGALYAYADAASLQQQAEALRYSHLSFLEATEVMHLSAQQDYFELFTQNLMGIRTIAEAETLSAESAKVKGAEAELSTAEQATDAQFKNVLSVFENSSKFFTGAANAASLKKHADYLKTVFGEKKKIVEIGHALEESPNDWSIQDRLLAQEQAYMQVLINSNPAPAVSETQKAADLGAAKQEIGQKRIAFARSNFLVEIEQEIQELQQFVAITNEGIEKHFRPAYYLYYPTAVGGLISGEVQERVYSEQDAVREAKNQILALEKMKEKIEAGEDFTTLGYAHVPKFVALAKLNAVVAQQRMPNEEDLADAYFTEAERYLNKGAKESREMLAVPLISVAKSSYRGVAERFCKVSEDEDEGKMESATECKSNFGNLAMAEYNKIKENVPVYEKLAPWFGTRETLVAVVSFEYLFAPLGRAVLVPAFAKFGSSRLGGFTAEFVKANAQRVGSVTKRFVSKIPYIESFGEAIAGTGKTAASIIALPKAAERAVLEKIAVKYPGAAGATKLLGKELADILPKPLTLGYFPKKLALEEGKTVPLASCAKGCEAVAEIEATSVSVFSGGEGAIQRLPAVAGTEQIYVSQIERVQYLSFGEMHPSAGGYPAEVNLGRYLPGSKTAVMPEEIMGSNIVRVNIDSDLDAVIMTKSKGIPDGAMLIELKDVQGRRTLFVYENYLRPTITQINRPKTITVMRLPAAGLQETEQEAYRIATKEGSLFTATENIARDIEPTEASVPLDAMRSMAEKLNEGGSVEVSLGGKGSAFRNRAVGYSSDRDFGLFMKITADNAAEAKVKAAQSIQKLVMSAEEKGMRLDYARIGGKEWTREEIMLGATKDLTLEDAAYGTSIIDFLQPGTATDGSMAIEKMSFTVMPFAKYPESAGLDLLTRPGVDVAKASAFAASSYRTSYFATRNDLALANELTSTIGSHSQLTETTLKAQVESLWQGGSAAKALKRYELLNAFKGNTKEIAAAREILTGDAGAVYEISSEINNAGWLVERQYSAQSKPFSTELTTNLRLLEGRLAPVTNMESGMKAEIVANARAVELNIKNNQFEAATGNLATIDNTLNSWVNAEAERQINRNELLKEYFDKIQ